MANDLLAGRSAFITGGAQGIGHAVARAFLAQGARVTIADVSADTLARAREALAAEHGDAIRAARLDVVDEAATQEAIAEAAQAQGRLDVVVANAGILMLKHTVDFTVEEWRRVVDINLTGAFITAKAAARLMLDQGSGGSLILTSSLFGLRGGVENSAYSASKFGMIGLAQSMAAELGPNGIRVNSICPGQIQTEMMDKLFADRAALRGADPAALKAGFEARIPLHRLGRMEDVADGFVYLASDLSRYVTGQALTIDGGWQVG